ncbi:MAG: response regulator [Gammaproteobacteria bacterium]
MTLSRGTSPRSATPQSDPAPIVFVVDGDAGARESLDSLIRGAGWRPETFSCARAFLSRPRACAPSCLVMEVDLQDINGLELQGLVADRVDLPVIFITSCSDVQTTVRAMKAGAFEFLTKPFDDDVVLRAIDEAIDRSRRAFAP